MPPPHESWLFVRPYQRGSVFVDPSNLVVKLAALFLRVRRRHFLIVGGDHVEQGDWWMGRLISLFQEDDVDTSVITWINADQVTDVIWSMDCWSTRH
ncbi:MULTISPECIES: DUF3104 domain-containing protein [unclassified Synechococcus]|uniref:DUF3104 domain-containing protein n=1 Tax=unclassified Synechococcus TaxID=2626047 RepID=UPI001CF8AD3B|nr:MULTISPECIES: DUF3104 domain-containing protein [unclassified Synechococcus]